jgi:hypothetical protein
VRPAVQYQVSSASYLDRWGWLALMPDAIKCCDSLVPIKVTPYANNPEGLLGRVAGNRSISRLLFREVAHDLVAVLFKYKTNQRAMGMIVE